MLQDANSTSRGELNFYFEYYMHLAKFSAHFIIKLQQNCKVNLMFWNFLQFDQLYRLDVLIPLSLQRIGLEQFHNQDFSKPKCNPKFQNNTIPHVYQNHAYNGMLPVHGEQSFNLKFVI